MTDDGDIPVRRGIVIPASELEETASRSSGPGGQHVNKSNTRVTLRWRVRESSALDPIARRRVEERLGARVTRAGELIVHAQTDALRTRAPRVPTRAAAGARARSRAAKRRHSAKKSARRAVRRDEDA
ncbi:MAG: aminoacyl-tRNA hydrolase [Deltaproteobacteria bacterium]|nr:MAG: aminoacyl-tRNA hydrolase [Deltaproteobacteria bacterium]